MTDENLAQKIDYFRALRSTIERDQRSAIRLAMLRSRSDLVGEAHHLPILTGSVGDAVDGSIAEAAQGHVEQDDRLKQQLAGRIGLGAHAGKLKPKLTDVLFRRVAHFGRLLNTILKRG